MGTYMSRIVSVLSIRDAHYEKESGCLDSASMPEIMTGNFTSIVCYISCHV